MEMKPEELRIGNWISLYGSPVKIHKGHIYDEITKYAETEPIPLTEEWLERFGFIGPSNGWYYIDHEYYRFVIGRPDDGAWLIMDDPTIRPILYVHQLQNLYYALSGTELRSKI